MLMQGVLLLRFGEINTKNISSFPCLLLLRINLKDFCKCRFHFYKYLSFLCIVNIHIFVI